jgi:hypothetical protein
MNNKVTLPESRNSDPKAKGRKEKQQPITIEFHDPLICERTKIQCDKCKKIYAAVIVREDNNYGFCGQCMGKKFIEIEDSRRVF